MKSLLRSTLSWFDRKNTPSGEAPALDAADTVGAAQDSHHTGAQPRAELAPEPVPATVVDAAPVIESTVAPVIEPVVKAISLDTEVSIDQPSSFSPASQPEPTSIPVQHAAAEVAEVAVVEPAAVVESIQLKLITRGAMIYAICGHCEANFNVQERLLRLKTAEFQRPLTCPGCNKPVSLPAEAQQRKLS